MSVLEYIQAAGALVSIALMIYNTFAIKEVHKQTNSMKDELVEEVRKASHAKGMKDEKAREENTHEHR